MRSTATERKARKFSLHGIETGSAAILGQRSRQPIALETGSDEALVQLLTDAVQYRLRTHFKEAVGKKKIAPNDIPAGRESVEAYVTYIHYVERLYEAAEKRLKTGITLSRANMSESDATR